MNQREAQQAARDAQLEVAAAIHRLFVRKHLLSEQVNKDLRLVVDALGVARLQLEHLNHVVTDLNAELHERNAA